MQQDVVAVVPTFHPGPALGALVRVLAETMPVVVSDDGSPCTADVVLREVSSTTGVEIRRHARNRGIARGLNDGLNFASMRNASWILTVDQDTTITTSYIATMSAEADRRIQASCRVGAVGAEIVHDASGQMRYPLTATPHGPVTEELIQTGTLWSVAALLEVGGFNEQFGIDAVDAAACLSLRKHGWAICVAQGTRVEHHLGSSRMVRILGRNVMITGHSPQRRSSMVRNRLRLFPAEFAASPKHAFRTLRRVGANQGLGLMLEPDRWAKAKGSIRGLRPPRDG